MTRRLWDWQTLSHRYPMLAPNVSNCHLRSPQTLQMTPPRVDVEMSFKLVYKPFNRYEEVSLKLRELFFFFLLQPHSLQPILTWASEWPAGTPRCQPLCSVCLQVLLQAKAESCMRRIIYWLMGWPFTVSGRNNNHCWMSHQSCQEDSTFHSI